MSFFPSGEIVGWRPAAVPIASGCGLRELAAKTVDVFPAHVEKTTRSSSVQNGALSFSGELVILMSCEPSGVVTYTSYVPDRFEMKAIASPDGDTDGRPPLVTRGAGCCAPSCDVAAMTRTSRDLGNMGVGKLRMPHATTQPQRRGGRPVWELFRTDDRERCSV